MTVPINEKGLVLSSAIRRTIKGWRAKNVTYTGEYAPKSAQAGGAAQR